MQWPVVREIGREVGESHEAERVRCLGHEESARPKLGGSQLEQPEQRPRVEVLDDVGAEDPAKGAVVEPAQVSDRVRELDVETFVTAVRDHVGICIDPSSLDAGVT